MAAHGPPSAALYEPVRGAWARSTRPVESPALPMAQLSAGVVGVIGLGTSGCRSSSIRGAKVNVLALPAYLQGVRRLRRCAQIVEGCPDGASRGPRRRIRDVRVLFAASPYLLKNCGTFLRFLNANAINPPTR